MIVDFFRKGHGFSYLKDVYHLTDEVCEKIKARLYYCEQHQPLTEREITGLKDIVNLIGEDLPIQDWMIHPQTQYSIIEDCMEVFFQETRLKIDEIDLSDVRFQCVHVSPTIDGGRSIREHGLLKLVDLLENTSPLSAFLIGHEIAIKPSEHWYSYRGEKRSVDGTDLAIKLYSTNSEIEAFIAGEKETLKNYSCIEDAPEILREISCLIYGDNNILIDDWARKKRDIVYVVFDVSFDECSNITDMAILKTPDNLERIIPYCSREYRSDEVPQSVWRNYWFIYQCIMNACPETPIDRSYMALKNNIKLQPNRIKVYSSKQYLE